MQAGERVLGTAACRSSTWAAPTWSSPSARTSWRPGSHRWRRRASSQSSGSGNPNGRGYFVQFEARMSQTGAKADEWIPDRAGKRGAGRPGDRPAGGREARPAAAAGFRQCGRGGGGRSAADVSAEAARASGGHVCHGRAAAGNPGRRGAWAEQRPADGRGRSGTQRIGGQPGQGRRRVPVAGGAAHGGDITRRRACRRWQTSSTS